MHVKKTLQLLIVFSLDFTFKENMYAEIIIVEMLSSLTNQCGLLEKYRTGVRLFCYWR